MGMITWLEFVVTEQAPEAYVKFILCLFLLAAFFLSHAVLMFLFSRFSHSFMHQLIILMLSSPHDWFILMHVQSFPVMYSYDHVNWICCCLLFHCRSTSSAIISVTGTSAVWKERCPWTWWWMTEKDPPNPTVRNSVETPAAPQIRSVSALHSDWPACNLGFVLIRSIVEEQWSGVNWLIRFGQWALNCQPI